MYSCVSVYLNFSLGNRNIYLCMHFNILVFECVLSPKTQTLLNTKRLSFAKIPTKFMNYFSLVTFFGQDFAFVLT